MHSRQIYRLNSLLTPKSTGCSDRTSLGHSLSSIVMLRLLPRIRGWRRTQCILISMIKVSILKIWMRNMRTGTWHKVKTSTTWCETISSISRCPRFKPKKWRQVVFPTSPIWIRTSCWAPRPKHQAISQDSGTWRLRTQRTSPTWHQWTWQQIHLSPNPNTITSLSLKRTTSRLSTAIMESLKERKEKRRKISSRRSRKVITLLWNQSKLRKEILYWIIISSRC